MTLVGTCADASGTISNATAYSGLSTGMKIAPCVVFPSGATVTDIATDGLSFTVSPASSEEAYKYTFTLYEPKVGGAAIVYVEAIAVSSAVAGILISGAAVMLESSFLDGVKATATTSGGSSPFAFHCRNTAAASATTNWGSRVGLGFISLEAVSAKSFLSGGNVPFAFHCINTAAATATTSGHSSPFAFHCINTAAATAIAGGLFVFFRATASTSATASAPIKVTRARFIDTEPTTSSRAIAVISGFNSYV